MMRPFDEVRHMKNLKKLIVITAMAALLICVAMTCAAADEKIYESPVFKLPVDRLQAEQWVENQPEETEAPAETDVVPGEEEQLPDQPTQAPDGETIVETQENGEPQRYVRIYSSQGKVVTEGEIIRLTSELVGFDGMNYTLQWQWDKGEGAGWEDIPNATRDSYTFIAGKETIKYSWRLLVNIDE